MAETKPRPSSSVEALGDLCGTVTKLTENENKTGSFVWLIQSSILRLHGRVKYRKRGGTAYPSGKALITAAEFRDKAIETFDGLFPKGAVAYALKIVFIPKDF